MYSSTKQKGAVALITVIIVGSAALIMAFNAILLGLNEIEIGTLHKKSAQAFGIADGCMEESLIQIRKDNTYGVGSGTILLSLLDETCTIVVTDLGSNQRRVNVLSTVDEEYHKRLEVTLTLTGTNLNIITIDTWEEKDS